MIRAMRMMAAGWFAVDINEKRNKLIRGFESSWANEIWILGG